MEETLRRSIATVLCQICRPEDHEFVSLLQRDSSPQVRRIAVDGMERSTHVMHLYAESIIPAAEQNLDAATSGYESGTNDFLALVAAEKALMIARLELEEATTEYHKGRAHLERAIGGELSSVEETP